MGTIVVKSNATNSDLQRAIEAAIPTAVKQMKQKAQEFKAATEEETCKKIFDYLKNQINYKADGSEQMVKLPSGLIRTRQGDCKSFSVFTSAILSNLGIPHKLVYAAYDPGDSTPTHIYVMTNKGCIIDAVYGKFNAEKQATNKKYKNMNISYISGIKGHRRIGDIGKYGPGGACGIGGTDGGLDWAYANGVYNSATFKNVDEKLRYAKNKILLALGRLVFRKLVEKNAGGLGNSLFILRQASKTAKSTDPAYTKMRAIEINWLEKGGNPYELYESIDEGNKKTPTGAYFNKLMKMKASGYTPNIAQWIAAGVSVLFGKKYNETTGKITGNYMPINGEPVSLLAMIAEAPVWVQVTVYTVTTLGGIYITAKVANAPGEGTSPPDGTDTNTDQSNNQTGSSMLLPIILVGGAAAAYFIFKKK